MRKKCEEAADVKDFKFDIDPVETYEPPEIPTFRDDKPTLLKKLPNRWQKHAKVIACVGLLGVGALALSAGGISEDRFFRLHYRSLTPIYDAREELAIRIHWGGAGSGPFYVVHLTEQETIGIIRAQLEAAGLSLNSTPPEHSVSIARGFAHANIDLFDEENAVAVSHIDWEDVRWGRIWEQTDDRIIESVREGFEKQIDDITIGVFYSPSETLNPLNSLNALHFPAYRFFPPSDRELRNRALLVRPNLESHLNAKVHEFVELLQSEGILE